MNNKNKNLKLYKNYLDSEETQKAIFFIEEKLIYWLFEYFHITRIRPPIFSYKEILNIDMFQRKISFDTIINNNVYSLYNNFDSWIITLSNKMELEINHGVFIKTNYIMRDIESLKDESFEKNELSINFRIGTNLEKNQKQKIIINFLKQIYDIFYKIYQELILTFKDLNKTIFSNKFYLIEIYNIREEKKFDLDDELVANSSVFVYNHIEEKGKIYFYNEVSKKGLLIGNLKIINNNLLITIDIDNLIILLLKKYNVHEIQMNLH